ncbi:hypothetical protein DVA67_011600 [Solirubrobacter sp. CPCC 204708]|uniref:DUF2231 domain-containing protein n=1 Tax=Solirubrobacter deserti TaxID=2282478 RepID=A0ABT4RPR8_9ACTN|nr:DUF2231 domain-containing protein [Solirubrobacter deserti]MBE2316624.1 hypothetical protein [Solirubrobacter deserti]MDA0140522.1 hypothetical protein [Solirubrobacter deserti]
MRDLRPFVVGAAVLSLVLWPVQISSAFGLPAHPLILHVPVVFVPLLGLATLIAVAKPGWFGVPLAAFAVVTLAATLLTVGAGEAFLESKPRLQGDPTMKDHQGAGETVRFTMALLTAALVALLWAKRGAANVALRVVAVLMAVSAIGFTIRTGHLGAKLVWEDDGQELTESTK